MNTLREDKLCRMGSEVTLIGMRLESEKEEMVPASLKQKMCI